MVGSHDHILVIDLGVVQAGAAAPDQTARLALAGGKPGAMEELDHAYSLASLLPGDFGRGQARGDQLTLRLE